MGKIVLVQTMEGSKSDINTYDIPAGVYILQANEQGVKILIGKVIILK